MAVMAPPGSWLFPAITMDGNMRSTLLGSVVILSLCVAGCGGGPPRAQSLEAIKSRAEARDTVYEKLTLPSTATVGWNKSFLEALESAGLINIGDCEEGATENNEGWIRCDVSLTEKGTHDLAPYRLGDTYFRIPISRPEYKITGTRLEEDYAFVLYSHTAIPSEIRQELGKHGYSRSLTCGFGTAIFVPEDEGWQFVRFQKQKKRACK